jgi:hypothetical protein
MYQQGPRSQPLTGYDGSSKKCTDNEIILIEEMNQLHRHGILHMFNLHCGTMYVLNPFNYMPHLHQQLIVHFVFMGFVSPV